MQEVIILLAFASQLYLLNQGTNIILAALKYLQAA